MNIPSHIGIIMDGNGRWAKKRGLPRALGHRAGVDALRKTLRSCGEFGVKYLTIYVFSTENWGRPRTEVSALMGLLVEMIHKEVSELKKNNVRLAAIGELDKLPEASYKALMQGIADTASCTGITLILTLSYGGRNEIVHAARQIAAAAVANPALLDTIDEETFAANLFTAPYPDPELIIRTGGDMRVSNFLLWQIAYSEIVVTNTLWPDFDRADLVSALEDFTARDRRFGKVKTAE